MNTLAKGIIGAATASAMLLSANPALAGYRGHDADKISAGEVIAGAVILGGLAAILSEKSNDRRDDRRYGDGYDGYDRGYDRNDDRGYHGGGQYGGYDNNNYGYRQQYGNGRTAVNKCITAVENWSNRYSRSKVTEIQDIERTRYGYRVKGNVVVRDGARGHDYGQRYGRDRGYYRGNGRGYDRGYEGGDNRGYDRGYDKGRFTCYIERGQVVDVDYRGLDNWR